MNGDPRGNRGFTPRQQREAWLQQEGRCAWCRRLLAEPMEGHHERIAWARGGPTDNWNCGVYHPECHHQMEGIMTRLRDWQKDALRVFVADTKQSFLIQAPVGAGKTQAALACYRAWQARERPPRPLCVIVSPSKNVLRKWLAEAYELVGDKVVVRSLDLEDRHLIVEGKRVKVRKCNIAPPLDDVFWLMSYGATAGSKSVLRELARDRQIFVIVDEVHRLESSESGVWGTDCEYAFQNARKILCLSATPFRTSGRPVSFLEYDDDGFALPGYQITWREALDEKYIVPLVFSSWDTVAGWTRCSIENPDDIFTMSGAISDVRTADEALATAVGKPIFQDEMLAEGARALDHERRIFPHGAGMVVCDFQEQAIQICQRLNQRKPGSAFAAISDNENAQQQMDAFRDGKVDEDWMVTVGMAREGCDIPRLKVLVWLSRVKTLQNFIQINGRIIRSVGNDDVVARCVLPEHPLLLKYANELLGEQRSGLRKPKEPNGGPIEAKTHLIHSWVEDATAGQVIRNDEASAVDEFMQDIAERTGEPIDVVELIVSNYESARTQPPAAKQPHSNKTSMRDEVAGLVARYSGILQRKGYSPRDIGRKINGLKKERRLPLEPIERYTMPQLESFRDVLVIAIRHEVVPSA